MAAEVAAHFRTANAASSNAGGEVYPGYPGLVIADGSVQSMVWGFPRAQNSKVTGKPIKPKAVNNARSDKLDSFFWRYSFAERRCLIPMSAWAEAQGKQGKKTRTWLSLPDAETFTVAGIWRDSDEWGRCYSMIMTDASEQATKVHNRMPVILTPDAYSTWREGTTADAKALCVPFTGELTIDQTEQPWTKRR